MKAIAALLLACAACMTSPAIAQSAVEVSMDVATLVHAGGLIRGCGVRVTGGRADPKGPSSWFDASLNVYSRGPALVQAIGYEIAPPEFDVQTRPERVAIQRAWLKVEDATGTTRLGENTDVRDSLVYAVTMDEAADLFAGLAKGKRLAIGVRRWGQREETVYVGTPELNEDRRRQLGACLETLVP
jgi:hypothetical protein